MDKRYMDELRHRMETVQDCGTVFIGRKELLRWFGGERIAVNTWRELHEFWADACGGDEEASRQALICTEAEDGYYFFDASKSVLVPTIVALGGWTNSPWLQDELKKSEIL